MIDLILEDASERMKKAIEAFQRDLSTIRTGRANPNMLDRVMVDYYGSMTPLKSLATISVPEATQLLIKPFDKGCLGNIEKAIIAANLGFNPSNDGETIRIVIPALTEERRRELTKQVKAMAEDAKVSIRNIRHEANEKIEKMELPEDEEKGMMKDVQDLVNEYNKDIDNIYKDKEKELMTV